MDIRVGFASRDGRQIDQCLRDASSWWIYDIGDTVQFVENRKWGDECDEKYARRPNDLLRKLWDCDLVVASSCREEFFLALRKMGKQFIETHAAVRETVDQIFSRNRQKISLDYYRKIREIGQEYGTEYGHQAGS